MGNKSILYHVTTISVIAITVICLIGISNSCNEQVCASIVSKCMLTQSCKCDLKNCTCCRKCYDCLNYLYNDCCSCLEMCPKPNETNNELSKKSYVDNLEGIPGLFAALTLQDDEDINKWTVFTFPVDFDAVLFGAKEKQIKFVMQSTDQNLESTTIASGEGIVTVNCTVAYMTQCLSWNKCRETCRSMGATSSRWFHDGCCQCVGATCINYGINESRCRSCPDDKYDNLDENIDDDDLDYGEGGFEGDVNA